MANTVKDSRAERLSKLCANINKSAFGGANHDAVYWLGSKDTSNEIEWIPSGDPGLDKALGGGWPRGRMIEVYGDAASGKSTLTLHALAEFQRKYPDDDCAIVDTEFTFDMNYAVALGVDPKYLIVHQPQKGPQALNIVKMLIQGGVKFIVVDSVAGLVTDAELEGDIGDTHVGELARLMSSALRQLVPLAGENKCTVFFTNQVRDKIGGFGFGEKTTTTGGHALKHYVSVRAQVVSIGKIKEKIDGEEVVAAAKTKVTVKKNKVAPPFREAEFCIAFGRGIDRVAGIFDAAIECGAISKSGNTFSVGERKIGVGRQNALEAVRGDSALCDELAGKVRVAMASGHKSAAPMVAPKVDEDEDVEIGVEVEEI